MAGTQPLVKLGAAGKALLPSILFTYPFYRARLKRSLDILFISLSLPFVLPLIGALALLVRRDGGPAFYSHVRIGRDGTAFPCWKLRTMAENAEEKLRTLLQSNPDLRAEWDQHQKLRVDPRVTPIGRILRQTSLDELPQLWNILRGDMSLVGPRPITRTELNRYGFWRARYVNVRPGLTGLWQVSGRNSLSYEHRIKMDAQYSSQLSLWLDFVILFKTIGVVFRRTGC